MASNNVELRSIGIQVEESQKTGFAAQHPHWHHTNLRIQTRKDVEVLTSHFGFTVVDEYTVGDVAHIFLATPTSETVLPGPPGSAAAHRWLWQTDLAVLELELAAVAEGQEPELFISGNVEPHRGFGHIAVHVEEVYSFCENLEAAGIKFQKKPDDGRMKGLAFALLPSGYWVEILSRGQQHPALKPCSVPVSLSQTMIRVRDPVASLGFYTGVLGMTLVRSTHFSDFSLFFLASLSPEQASLVPADDKEAAQFVKTLHNPVLELTHNHGTESNPDFSYVSGNDDGLRGFGHVAFLVDSLTDASQLYTAAGLKFKQLPHQGPFNTLAVVYDPDGYWVEIIQRSQ